MLLRLPYFSACILLNLFTYVSSFRPKYSYFMARKNSPMHAIESIEATVLLRGIDVPVHGIVNMKQDYFANAPVYISGFIEGLPANSTHALHVHTFGDLTSTCYSTSGHFNPDWTVHGSPNSYRRHVGDIGNVKLSENGQFQLTDSSISLFGRTNVIGRALVLHALDDKYDQKLVDGGAGSRIACGVIAVKHLQHANVQPVFYHWFA